MEQYLKKHKGFIAIVDTFKPQIAVCELLV